MRVLLCFQGLYLGFLAWDLWPGWAPHGDFWAFLVLELVLAFLGLATIVAAVLLRRGRRWAAIAAILIEALWATLAAAIAYKTLKDWPLDLHLLGEVTAARSVKAPHQHQQLHGQPRQPEPRQAAELERAGHGPFEKMGLI